MQAIANHIGNNTYRTRKNKFFLGLVIFFSLLTISPIVLIIYKLIAKGIRQINLSFFTETAPDTFEAMTAINSGEIIPGGILNGITGTLFMVIMAAIIAIPIGILIGLYLYENPGKVYANIAKNNSITRKELKFLGYQKKS